jgi:shikimate dehydrogenase
LWQAEIARSVGLAPNVDARLDLDPDSIREGLVVCDVIPNPTDTALVRDALERGARTRDGRVMLAFRGRHDHRGAEPQTGR